MKKRYHFSGKNCFWLWLVFLLLVFFSLNVQGQNKSVKQWERTFGTKSPENFHFVKPTIDGGFIIGVFLGCCENRNPSIQDTERGRDNHWVIKIDSSGNKQWDRIFSSNTRNWFSFLHQTSDGGYILGGRHFPQFRVQNQEKYDSAKVDDVRVIKLDMNGRKQWEKICGVRQERTSNPVLQLAPDGGFFIYGFYKTQFPSGLENGSAEETNFWLIRMDPLGNEIWKRIIAGNYGDKIPISQVTPNGGIVLGGTFLSNSNSDQSKPSLRNSNFWLIKLDNTGKELWEKKGDESGNIILSAIKITSDNEIILEGASNSGSSTNKFNKKRNVKSIWLAKMNSEGNIIWGKSFSNFWYEINFPLQKTSDSGYLIQGRFQKKFFSAFKFNFRRKKFIHYKLLGNYHRVKLPFRIYKKYYTKRNLWLVKVDSTGVKQWEKKYNGNKAWLSGLTVTKEGDFFYTETIGRVGMYDKTGKAHKTNLVKLNSLGNKVWTEIISENDGKFPWEIHYTADGNLIIGGNSQSNYQTDIWIVKCGTKK